MALQIESPAPLGIAETGLNKMSFPGGNDGPETPTKSAAAQEACRDMIRDDLCANIGAMVATLNAALAMRDASDDTGLIYALRRARAYWQSIAASARELQEARQ